MKRRSRKRKKYIIYIIYAVSRGMAVNQAKIPEITWLCTPEAPFSKP